MALRTSCTKSVNIEMDFIKRRLSLGTDPDKDQEEISSTHAENSSSGATLLETLSQKQASVWNGFTSKIKAQSNGDSSIDEGKANSFAFIDSMKRRLQKVRLPYENGKSDSDHKHEVECAPLIDTTESKTDESEVTDSNPEDEKPELSQPNVKKKLLNRRQDSFTAEEIYLDEVAGKVKLGLVLPDKDTPILSPSKAVQEFCFTENKHKALHQGHTSLLKKPAASNTIKVPSSNLINFDSMLNLSAGDDNANNIDIIVHHEDDGVFEYESSGEESSEPVYSGLASRRSTSLDSLHSTQSAAFDEETKEFKEFSQKFVEHIFSDTTNTTEDKAKFGRYVQDGSFRQEFAKAVSDKRGLAKAVTEQTFYQLVQYFAVVLFECEQADDFSPAMTLMTMCFTFYYESSRAGKIEKNFLSSYLKNQPIWQSLRYWNAAFYEAVQKERNRKPLPTNKDTIDEEEQDRTFQENIIFGQLGTFLFNMRAFGLNKEWCLEFLRKQATIGSLNNEQVMMLREYIDMDQLCSQ